MIPPLFLEVKPKHRVMDMCAAPGSKTSQLLEMLHAASGEATPRGVVVANDASLQRANLLTHQCKRSHSPALIVTNHQAQLWPILYDGKKGKKLRFDRILADVPCSGDGTLRKSPDLWKKWNASSGVDLHSLQLEIATHALRLLEVGGRLVYSTCSLNPLENESVVAALLKRAKGSVELVGVSKSLPELKRRPGMKKWKVGDVFAWHNSFEETGKKRQKTVAKTMFWEPSYESLPLERCVRVFPHLDDTGGFFITVFQKTSELPDEMEATPRVDANTAYRMERANAEWNEKKRVAPVMKVEDRGIVEEHQQALRRSIRFRFRRGAHDSSTLRSSGRISETFILFIRGRAENFDGAEQGWKKRGVTSRRVRRALVRASNCRWRRVRV